MDSRGRAGIREKIFWCCALFLIVIFIIFQSINIKATKCYAELDWYEGNITIKREVPYQIDKTVINFPLDYKDPNAVYDAATEFARTKCPL